MYSCRLACFTSHGNVWCYVLRCLNEDLLCPCLRVQGDTILETGEVVPGLPESHGHHWSWNISTIFFCCKNCVYGSNKILQSQIMSDLRSWSMSVPSLRWIQVSPHERPNVSNNQTVHVLSVLTRPASSSVFLLSQSTFQIFQTEGPCRFLRLHLRAGSAASAPPLQVRRYGVNDAEWTCHWFQWK